MKTQIEKITPERAATLLQNNQNNRPLDKARISLYTHAIESGQWVLNGDTIKLSPLGRLLDGQHRLNAIVRAGVPVVTVIAYDVDESVFPTIDCNKVRTSGDALHIMNIKNAARISSSIARFLKLISGHLGTSKGITQVAITTADILNEYNSRPNFWQNIVLEAQTYLDRNYWILAPSEYCAFSAFFQTKHEADKVRSFWENLSNQSGVCGLLYSRLMKNKISKSKLTTMEKNALILKAFIHFVNEADIKVLRWSYEESFPQI